MQEKRHKFPTRSQMWFTLIELIIATMLSTIILGWVFFFLSDTLDALADARNTSQVLYELQSFTTLFSEQNTQILDFWPNSYDVAILKSDSSPGWILVWVVDWQSRLMAAQWSQTTYSNTVLGYRNLSESELVNISSNPTVVFTYNFFPDKLYTNLHVRDLQMQHYNTWDLLDFNISLSPYYIADFAGQPLNTLPIEDVSQYSFIF